MVKKNGIITMLYVDILIFTWLQFTDKYYIV